MPCHLGKERGGDCKSGIGRTRGLQPDPTRHLVGNGLQISLIDEVRMIHDSHPPPASTAGKTLFKQIHITQKYITNSET